jgi:uncharacterized membrane protein YcaP (DUF421 family)
VGWVETLFGAKGDVTALQECARAALIFAYGLLLVRVAGRRVFGKWGALDIIVSIMVGSNLSRALTGSAPLLGTMAATAVLMALHWVLAMAAARSTWLSHALEGRAVVLAISGATVPGKLARHSVTEADLNEAIRQSGAARLEETQRITLEPSGKITVLKGG